MIFLPKNTINSVYILYHDVEKVKQVHVEYCMQIFFVFTLIILNLENGRFNDERKTLSNKKCTRINYIKIHILFVMH